MNLNMLNSNKARRWLPVVKQFTATFILALTLIPRVGLAKRSCIDLFTVSPNLATDLHEKSFNNFINENDSKYKKIKDNPSMQYAMSKEELNYRFNTPQVFDRAMLGVLGQLFDLKINPQTKKNETVRNKFEYSKIEKESIKIIEAAKNTDNTKYNSIFNSALEISELTQNTVLVQFSSLSPFGAYSLESAVKQCFHSQYLAMVNWKYRSTGLMENKVQSSLLMMDDAYVYLNEKKYFDFSLVFDKKIWEMQKSIITQKINKYNEALTDEQRLVIFYEISQGKEPLMPMAGMAQAKTFSSLSNPQVQALLKTPKQPVELKRYFKNDLEDPLGLLKLEPKKDEFLIRNNMIYKIIDKLPEGTPLEIHAHTEAHVEAYAKWGFVDNGLIESEKYKDTNVHLLTASREVMLQKIKAIIDKNQ